MRHVKFLHPPRLSPPIHPGISCLFDLSHYVSFLLKMFSSEMIMKKEPRMIFHFFTTYTNYYDYHCYHGSQTHGSRLFTGTFPHFAIHQGPAPHTSTQLIRYRILWANAIHMQQPITDLTELLNLLGKHFFGVTCMPCDKFWARKCLLSKLRKSGIYLRALMLDSFFSSRDGTYNCTTTNQGLSWPITCHILISDIYLYNKVQLYSSIHMHTYMRIHIYAQIHTLYCFKRLYAL